MPAGEQCIFPVLKWLRDNWQPAAQQSLLYYATDAALVKNAVLWPLGGRYFTKLPLKERAATRKLRRFFY